MQIFIAFAGTQLLSTANNTNHTQITKGSDEGYVKK